MFEEHLYNGHNFAKLTQRLVDSMGSYLKTKVVEEINEHPSIIKLVTFYNDEFGGSDNSGPSHSNNSSKFSLASGTSRSSRSERTYRSRSSNTNESNRRSQSQFLENRSSPSQSDSGSPRQVKKVAKDRSKRTIKEESEIYESSSDQSANNGKISINEPNKKPRHKPADRKKESSRSKEVIEVDD